MCLEFVKAKQFLWKAAKWNLLDREQQKKKQKKHINIVL